VPDVGALNLPGASAESAARHRGAGDNAEGLRGLKALGVRDLNYRMSFLACGVSSAGYLRFFWKLPCIPVVYGVLRGKMSTGTLCFHTTTVFNALFEGRPWGIYSSRTVP
jgi:hypothetical protein